MEGLNVCLVDFDRSSSSRIAREIHGLFTDGTTRVRQVAADAVAEGTAGQQSPPDILILILPREIGEIERAYIRTVSREPGRIPVLAVIDHADPDALMDLFRQGVADFITPPLKRNDILPRLWRLAEHSRTRAGLTHRLKEAISMRRIIGASPVFMKELNKLPLITQCESTVLVSGETGTGKEMVARAIHYLGPRAGKPFVPVNCGAIPAELVENELFGHARGAYTGADSAQAGLLREADGGTILLDEIDCLPLPAQVKLLRLLQDKEYRQLGSPKTSRADVRIIAATNGDLGKSAAVGMFRQDLLYRLNSVQIALPPLRERAEDIPLLARHFLAESANEFNKAVEDFAPGALGMLAAYAWPGNIRELQNIVKRAALFCGGPLIVEDDIALPRPRREAISRSFQEEKARVVAAFEIEYMQGQLSAHKGNITRAAMAAGKNRRAFWALIRKHNIDVQRYKPVVD